MVKGKGKGVEEDGKEEVEEKKKARPRIKRRKP